MGLAYREARLTLKFYFWENNLDHGLLDQLWIRTYHWDQEDWASSSAYQLCADSWDRAMAS